MPQFRVLVPLFINNKMAEVDSIIDYEGDYEPDHLEPLSKKGKGKSAAAAEDSQEQAGE